MSYPGDVLLPVNAKYFGFVDDRLPYNSHWDLTWSFQFCLSGQEHAVCTFLTTNPNLSSAIPGHYMGYMGDIPYILSEQGEILYTEDGEKMLYETLSSYNYDLTGVLAITFDSTGYFALSNSTNQGIGLGSIKPNSLIIRDTNNNVVFNETLSTLNSSFTLSPSSKSFTTIRVRLANGGRRVSVDFKTGSNEYQTLTSISLLGFNPDINTIVYPGLIFCSPLSSSSINPSTLYIKNFHVEGMSIAPTYETLPMTSLYNNVSLYTSISAISAL